MQNSLLHMCILGCTLSFISIACKSLQQKSVQYNRYLLIPPVSYVQACAELFTAGIFSYSFLNQTWVECLPLALSIGTGGWIGCISGMKLQAWLVKKLYKIETKH